MYDRLDDDHVCELLVFGLTPVRHPTERRRRVEAPARAW